jgi:hypothetical protein
MNAPDLFHAISKLRTLKRMNHARSKLYERHIEDSLTKLAAWADAEDGSEEQQRAWETWLHSPLPSW